MRMRQSGGPRLEETPRASPTPPRLLVSSAALLWGLQFAFLNPALALLLVALYDATPPTSGGSLPSTTPAGLSPPCWCPPMPTA
ncbi:hypothetical protein ACVWYS_000337 [Arthrobacter sp. TE12231]